jgi:uncharacterized ferritin-like protein (DUF455 family)
LRRFGWKLWAIGARVPRYQVTRQTTHHQQTVEHWAVGYITTTSLIHKQGPPPPPDHWARAPRAQRIAAPGRPGELRLKQKGARTPKPEGLADPRCRARLLHTFWHHELQAAELMCWALLAFADAPIDFRRGLLAICLDEIRHMQMYRAHMERLGHQIGDFPVRDWFWERVPACETPVQFVALMGMGFEAANLEHAPHFAEQFRNVGDEAGASIQQRVAFEERAHVGFAVRWFKRWTGGCRFDDWQATLPAPLSPLVLRGAQLDVAARVAAGFPREFVDGLNRYVPEDRRMRPTAAARDR